MKLLSVATSALVALGSIVSVVNADAYSDAMKEWCDGMSRTPNILTFPGIKITFPSTTTVVGAGSQTKVSVTRVPNQHEKSITGLDLYMVEGGSAKYINNIWHGMYSLNTQASITDTIPANTTAGLYYYRVWVTNMIQGQQGPACTPTSATFKVTSAGHTNDDGTTTQDDPNDTTLYNPEYQKGCFGLDVKYPAEGQTVDIGKHLRLQLHRDSASQTDELLQVDLFKGDPSNQGQFVQSIFTGEESINNILTLKDHIVLPSNVTSDGDFFYSLKVSSDKVDKTQDSCTFYSKNFKITESSN
ncbi:hypothetical protein INT43_007010 [Umbelopsis isabellina]|uniref:Uncharacterized protein n=1 Tax=Mortierella isabellina TaxID=91625 RepID=A0A8H7PYE1_MORIS|nr:hypothetical protein INT43_007010 [Umbelopsis isabellina]